MRNIFFPHYLSGEPEFVCLQNGSKKKKQSPQIIDFVGFVIRWLSDVSEALRCVRDSNP